MAAGMNDKVGLLSYRLDQDAFDKPYSDETAHLVDTEVRSKWRILLSLYMLCSNISFIL